MNPDQKALVDKFTELQQLLSVPETTSNHARISVLMIELRALSDKKGVTLPDELFIAMNQDSKQSMFAMYLGLIAMTIGGVI